MGGCKGQRRKQLWVSRGILPQEILKNLSCLSQHFLHSESNFNLHSRIRRTFVAHEWVRTHPSHPPVYAPSCTSFHLSLYFCFSLSPFSNLFAAVVGQPSTRLALKEILRKREQVGKFLPWSNQG